jgi:hypothetical protein
MWRDRVAKAQIIQEARRIGQTLGRAWADKLTANVTSLLANATDQGVDMVDGQEIERALREAVQAAMFP